MILEVNGKPMSDSRELRMTISMMSPDSTINLKVMRNGNPTDLSVKLGELPTDKDQAKAEEGSSDQALDGVTLENIDAQTARELGLPATTTGVVVTDASPSSSLASAGAAARGRHSGSESSTCQDCCATRGSGSQGRKQSAVSREPAGFDTLHRRVAATAFGLFFPSGSENRSPAAVAAGLLFWPCR